MEIKHMHQKVRPCILADIRVEFKVWQTWTVKEDGSAGDLEQTDYTNSDEEFWLCRNCREEFWYWPEVHKHFAEAETAMAAVV
jgi:hypothetical protein